MQRHTCFELQVVFSLQQSSAVLAGNAGSQRGSYGAQYCNGTDKTGFESPWSGMVTCLVYVRSPFCPPWKYEAASNLYLNTLFAQLSKVKPQDEKMHESATESCCTCT